MEKLDEAFAERPGLKRQIEDCLDESPQHSRLFLSICDYVNELRSNAAPAPESGPAAKKRRLDASSTAPPTTAAANHHARGGWADPASKPAHSTPDVSFSLPARKKLTLQTVGGAGGGLRAVSAAGNGAVEFGLGWQDVYQVLCLPVPERQRRAWSFVVIPHASRGDADEAPEQMAWTYQEPSAKERAAALAGGAGAAPPEEPGHTAAVLDRHLAPLGKSVVAPEEGEFASAAGPGQRKGERAFHVRAFRGSKEGFLFLLATGILFGFRKPLLFFGLERVASVSYTSVLQRTFNLVVATLDGLDVEFAMLDQADFAGIDAYVKAHGLNDASLAKERAAKVYNVNKDRRGGGGGEDGAANGGAADGAALGEDGLTELQRAEKQLQDEEDDMEEDFDPDAGESDTGSSGEEEEEEEEEDYVDGEGDGDEVDGGDGDEDGEGDGYEDGTEEFGEEETAAARGFTSVVNGRAPGGMHFEQEPDEPEDGFL